MMTWPEVKQALAAGKTTALVYNGGTEQRGPQNVNGGHTLLGREQVRDIALKLGNAIAAPVLPFSPNRASADLPGTIGLTNEIFEAINEQIAEELIKTGFKNVVLMGDHGGGQAQLKAWPPGSTPSTPARASAWCSATRSTPRPTATSMPGSRPRAIPPARMPAYPTPPRCSTSAATRGGCARPW